MSAPTHVIIVGAGLAGALMACFLGKRGYRVDVYERRPDPRVAGFAGGRSINLALSTRGLAALERVGLAEQVLESAIPMRGRMIHAVSGRLAFQPYSKNPRDAINSVSRGGLNVTLLDAAERCEAVALHFEHTCLDVDLDRPSSAFEAAAGEPVTATADVVIGADGAFSAVRGRLQRTDRFDYAQTYLEHGYKELTIPAPAGDGFALEPNALHIWPRGGLMMIALPNVDRTFTCTLFWPFTGPGGFDRLRRDEDVLAFFREQFGDAVPLMPALAEEYRTNPTSSLVTVRCRPWHHEDRVVLIGDAAHAIVPFFGQGMNAAFEDCLVLDRCLALHEGDRGRALAEFTAARKEDADAIAAMALENFIEMRDKVKSRRFLLKKRLEKQLHRWFPRRFMPLYNMVSFSTIPYAEAQRRGRAQERALRLIGFAAAALAVLIVAGVVMALIELSD